MLKRSLKDISFSIKTINELIAEEQQAVDLYRQAISECDDPTCLDVYSHILQEEIEHIEELKKLKEDLTQPVEAKDSKFRDSKIKYIVVVNGERYASFDNYEDAVQCENSFYSSTDEDAENYYGSYPDVRIIKEDAYGRRIRDSKVKKIKYGKPNKYDKIYYSVEGSEEGEIFDNLKTLSEARAKIKGLKKNDKENDIEQDYIINKHYLTEDEDWIEEV